MDHRSKLLLLMVLCAVGVSLGATYYRYIVNKDFEVLVDMTMLDPVTLKVIEQETPSEE